MAEFIKALLEFLVKLLSQSPKTPKVQGNSQPTDVADLTHLKSFEELRLKAYLPTKHDVWTIGWGHTATAYQGMEITEKEAEALLRSDLAWVRKAIKDLVKVPLSQLQYDALAGLIFNIGRPNFESSTVLKRLNAYDYVGAADAFLMWDKQRQNGKLVVLKGLVRRRAEESAMFLKGTTL